MDDSNRSLDSALEGLDEGKRATLKRLIGTGAFIGPMVVSFAMADLTIDVFMHSAAANATTPHPTTSSTTTPAPRTHPTKS